LIILRQRRPDRREGKKAIITGIATIKIRRNGYIPLNNGKISANKI